MIRRYRQAIVLLPSLFLIACNSTSQINENINNISLPTQWSQSHSALTIQNNWLATFNNPQINQLVFKALNNNHQLKAQAYALDSNKQQLIISGSELWPALDLSIRNGRSKNGQSQTYAKTNSINLNANYELDIWGKLSAADKKSNFTYLAQQAAFDQLKQQLVANVVIAYFSIVEAENLLTLYQSRVTNSQQNLDIIESGYNAGLNAALDVYLARNELNNELTRKAEQKTATIKQVRKLERLLGDYPEGILNINVKLPLLSNSIPVGLPSDLISRKPDLKASWYQLLAKDAALAFAHKQRFPSLRLAASVGDSTHNIEDLLSGSSLAWSLLNSVSAPIFNAGRLAANEEKARHSLKQSEQQYLDTLYEAFSAVENAISTENKLKLTYQTMLAAQENAQIAATLSFEQYQSGLVVYTTVLDAQSRYFDAQNSLIKIKSQLLTNRITLHFSLGGDFSSPLPKTEAE